MISTSRMDKAPLPFLLFSLILLLSCTAIDGNTITPTQFIRDPQTLTSSGEIYKLGFFSPANSTNRYVGIWYNKVSVQTIVWVANRDNPLKDFSGVLRIAKDGNLVLLDGGGIVLWTTNVSNIPVNNSIAELLDSGNFVLQQVSDKRILWQSFEEPMDTFLPTMKVGANIRTGKTIVITSWKAESNPSTGNFFSGLELIGTPQIVIWNGSQRHWRSGPWNNRIFIGVSTMYSVYLDGFYIIRDALEDAVYMTFNYFNQSSFTRYVLDHSGELFGERWDEGGNGWYRFFSTRDNDDCDAYGKCGPFGTCNILDSPICSCLRGFKPKSEDEWSKGNWSGGCVRKTELQCERNRNSTISISNAGEKEDGFLKLEMMKVPDFAYWTAPKSVKECGQECLKNCSCLAYSYDNGVGCMIWGQTLVDIQKFSKGAGVDLHIRVAHSELVMNKALLPFSLFSLTLLLSLYKHCSAIDNTTVTLTQYITDPKTVTSSGEKFKLGFFSPGNSTNRYVGIWSNKVPGQTIVWVANRNNPLKDSSGVLRIANNGNLVVLDGRGVVLWTTNVSNIASSNSTAELLDSGNLVLRQVSDQRVLWQSFEDPTDTFLPTMMIGANRRTGKTRQLTSWNSKSDPSTGIFTAGIELTNIPQAVIWNNGSQRHWRSGPWNNRIFIGIPTLYSVYLDGFYIDRDALEDTVYMTFNYFNRSSFSRYVLNHRGELIGQRWDEGGNGWYQFWSTKDNDECDVYSKCGPYGSCNILDSPICSCLRGFTPKSDDEWSEGNWSGGCVRKTELQCQKNKNSTSSSGSNEAEKPDGFLKLENMKVPDFAYWKPPKDVKECEQECLKNCSCLAYSYDSGVGCMIWGRTLVDIQKFSKAVVDLHIRVAHSELGMLELIFILKFLWIAFSQDSCKKEMEISLFNIDNNVYEESSDSNMLGDNPDLKIFKFEQLAVATNHFGGASKLGEGGFGSVYKGKFTDGQEIAVKRLSKGSGQGLEEFKNEVLVISKLQHRNLVRLFGCCVEGEEKMLIYEYMPNKSLDAFLFDSTKRALLDWNKRFQIIEGISRGILYLHRDSRLRVIHRDLKASNILLDEELNPKISDFGMARIFGGNEMQANTKRVVGTYGYMSPEYAMEGRFSEKSDVFSFGVLLLEIVSGRRNSSFYHHELSLSLLGYAWQLWSENKTKSLIDPMLLSKPFFELEILRCIHVGLLCVQEFAKDRPTISITLSMLTSEITTLPTPKQPAFVVKGVSSDSNSSQKRHKSGSVNNVTITNLESR
ncbi:Protein kinase domain [Macleaya cordata]|uniref:non-specific serine/threonine protein kinase n=1 Tax=Macleaya cordata TaxID=56857 RepID=A0A200QQN7_MACCD|nr:Protein kinase domain [Macleaya cordata]